MATGDGMEEEIDTFNLAILYAKQGCEELAIPVAQKASRLFCKIGYLEYFSESSAVARFPAQSGNEINR